MKETSLMRGLFVYNEAMRKTILIPLVIFLSSCGETVSSSVAVSSSEPAGIESFAKESVLLPNGETMAYLKAGNGPQAILAVHGNYSSSLSYYRLLANPPSSFTIYAMDLRGYGDSSYHAPISSMKDFADDVISFADALEINSFGLIGWSLGGAVAMELACHYPTRVNHLALLSSAATWGYPLYDADGNAYSDKDAMAENAMEAGGLAALEAGNRSYVDRMMTHSMRWSSIPQKEKNAYLDETMKERCLKEATWALASFNITNEDKGYGAENLLTNLGLIQTAVFDGTLDTVLSAAMVTSRESLPFAVMKRTYSAGHSILTEQTAALLSDLNEFFSAEYLHP